MHGAAHEEFVCEVLDEMAVDVLEGYLRKDFLSKLNHFMEKWVLYFIIIVTVSISSDYLTY